MSLPQYNGFEIIDTKRVWFNTAAEVLKPGYALCYDSTASMTATDPKLRYGTLTKKPATADLQHFAGVIVPTFPVTTVPVGGCWVDIIMHRKNCVIPAIVDNAVAAGSTVKVQNGSYSLAIDATGAGALTPAIANTFVGVNQAIGVTNTAVPVLLK